MELKPQNEIDHQELGYRFAMRLINAAREKTRKRLNNWAEKHDGKHNWEGAEKKGSQVKHIQIALDALFFYPFAIFLHSYNKTFSGPMDSGITVYSFEWLVVKDKILLVETLSTLHLDILEGQSKIFCIK